MTSTSGASHEIVMRMVVPVSCRMTATTQQVRLTGTADDGGAVDTTLAAEGGLVVDCNTPYAMSLQRESLLATRRRTAATSRGGIAKAPDAQGLGTPRNMDAAQLASAEAADAADELAAQIPGDMDVLVRVAGLGGLGGAMEANCVMAAPGETPFVCHAFAGPEDARLPPQRATARVIVTGTLNRAGSAAEPVAVANANVNTASGATVATDARAVAGGRHVGERLTVSLSARY